MNTDKDFSLMHAIVVISDAITHCEVRSNRTAFTITFDGEYADKLHMAADFLAMEYPGEIKDLPLRNRRQDHHFELSFDRKRCTAEPDLQELVAAIEQRAEACERSKASHHAR